MTSTPFALAAKYLDRPTETFIQLHAARLAPGRTSLLAADQARPDSGPFRDVPGYWGFRREVKAPLVQLGLRRSAVSGFLRAQGVRCLLAEYGDVGRWLVTDALAADVRLFVYFLGYDATRALRSRRARWAHRRLFARAEGVFAPSEFLKTRLVEAGCPAGKIHAVPCGAEMSGLPLSGRQSGRLLAVGRFVEKKAPLTLLRAFAKAARQIPRLHLDYVGDGPLLAAARAQIEAAGLADRVTFHGTLPHADVHVLMGRAEMFVQHSVTAADGDCEGLPVAILEAMGCGLPVVSTRHAGIPEAVLHGRTGLLVAEHDADAMAQAIMEYATSPRARMDGVATAARHRVETAFSAERSLATLRSVMGIEGLLPTLP